MATNQTSTRSNNGESIAIGIDLGTTNSVCAWVSIYINPLASASRLQWDWAMHIPRNHRDRPQRITPSIVSVDSKNGELLAGVDAEENEASNPGETVRSVKRLMGLSWDHDDVVRRRGEVGYISRDEAGMAAIKLSDKLYTPQAISAEILRRIRTDAEECFKPRKVTHAVISVPASFKDHQRRATWEAAREAGLIVKRIVTEPVAATYGYGFGLTPGEVRNVLVFDLGGGTFDAAIVRAAFPLSIVDNHMGDPWLGGDDVDTKLLELTLTRIRQMTSSVPSEDRSLMARLRGEIRRAKEVLCLNRSGNASESLDLNGWPMGADGRKVAASLSLRDIEEASSGIVDKAMGKVMEALRESGKRVSDVDDVVLVGGGSYLPGVEKRLKEIFPADRIRDREEPIYVVGLGCAVLACLLPGTECPKCSPPFINDVEAVVCRNCGALLGGIADMTANAYGIEVQGGAYEIVLEKGTRFGQAVSRTFCTSLPNQRRIYIPVYQGQERSVQGNTAIGFKIFELSAPKPVETPVEVKMSVGANSILEVEVLCDGERSPGSKLRAGDWMTGLMSQVAEVRRVGYSTPLVSEAEKLISDSQTVTSGSSQDAEVRAEAQRLSKAFQDLDWDKALFAIQFLEKVTGERSPSLPYVMCLDQKAQTSIHAALKRFYDYRVQKSGERVEVSNSIWDAVDTLGGPSARSSDRCLFLILLYADPDSGNPDCVLLSRDRAELDAHLRSYKDAMSAGRTTAADASLDSAQKLLAAVATRDYLNRIKHKAPSSVNVPYLKTLGDQRMHTRPVR